MPVPRGSRGGPYPGHYSYGYPGPDRPFPEPQRARVPTDEVWRPVPPAALAAGALGIAGSVPLALLVGGAVSLGGLWMESRVEWWLYPLLVAPVLQLWGAVALLSGRSWRLFVISCLPATGLFGYLVYVLFAQADGLEFGYSTFALCAPLPALLLAATPRVRRWVAARRRARGTTGGLPRAMAQETAHQGAVAGPQPSS